MMKQVKEFVTDKRGKVVIWQTPNLALIIWFLATVQSKLISYGRWHSLFDIVAFGAIFAWSWGEIWDGSSPFRRVLGTVILVLSVMGRVR